MRRTKLWLVLALAVICGGAAGFLALELLQDRASTETASSPPTTQVVVATRALQPGSVVGREDVKTVEWPTSSASSAFARDVREVVGRGVTAPVSADEPLLRSKLAIEEAGGGLSVVIPDGMRAMSVKVDEVSGVAGFVLPGTRVDVLVTLNPTNDRGSATSKVILQDVEVVTSGQTIERDAEGSPRDVPVVTLLVTPEQAEKLTLALTEGTIHLVMRNTLDREKVQTSGSRAATLVTSERPNPNPAPRRIRRAARPAPGHSVTTYDGTEKKVSTF